MLKKSILRMDKGTNWQEYNFKVPITTLGVDPDGTRVLLGHNDGTLTLFNVATGKHEASFGAHKGSIRSIVFLNSTTAVSISREDSTIRAWDVYNGKATGMVRPNAVPNVVARISETAVVVGSTKGMIYVVEWNNSKGYIQTAEKMASTARNPVPVTRISVCGKKFLTVTDDNACRIWEVEGMKCLRKVSDVVAFCGSVGRRYVVISGCKDLVMMTKESNQRAHDVNRVLYVMSAEAPFRMVKKLYLKEHYSQIQLVGEDMVLLQSVHGNVIAVYDMRRMIHLKDIRLGRLAQDFKMMGDGRVAVACGAKLMIGDTTPEVKDVATKGMCRVNNDAEHVISVGGESVERVDRSEAGFRLALWSVVGVCFGVLLGSCQ